MLFLNFFMFLFALTCYNYRYGFVITAILSAVDIKLLTMSGGQVLDKVPFFF